MLLSDLAEDVLRAIFTTTLLLRDEAIDVASLASTSRRLREICAPILFSRCVTTCSGRKGIPPETIRPLIQHLIYTGRLVPECEGTFGLELPHLPRLRAVIFRGRNLCDMPWTAFKRCLSLPNIQAITFEPTTSFIGIHPNPLHEIKALPLALTTLSYNPNIWRLLYNNCSTGFSLFDNNEPSNRTSPYTTEFLSLSPVVLRVHETLQSLTLPIESVPLDEMVRLPWPQLRELCISGQRPGDGTLSLLREFIIRLPRLAALSIQLALENSQGRLALLSSSTHHDTPLVLDRLSLAYPDPDDAIFSIDHTSLKHLSLRDQPRYYYHLAWRFPEVSRRWSTPLLSPAECLSILRRMKIPDLRTLELVYMADGNEDDELLEHVSRTFPCLEHLELHRYRKDRHQATPYAHVARALVPMATLITVNLNLDFHDDVQLYSENISDRTRYKEVRDGRGAELADIFEACPALEYVGLLTHGVNTSYWAQFHPRRCAQTWIKAGPVDSPPLPHLPTVL